MVLRRIASRLRNEHVRDTAWALVDQGAMLFASTLSFLLLGRTLGASGYGAFVGLYSLIGPFLALGQSGVQLTAMEHIARVGEPPAEVGRSCLSITLLNGLLWVPMLSAASLLWIKNLPVLAAVLLIANEFWTNAIFTQSAGIVQVVRDFPTAARLRIGYSLLRIVPLAVLAAAHSLTLTTIAVGQAITSAAMMSFGMSRVSRLAGAPVRPGRIHRPHLRSVALYAFQVGATNVQSDGDKFALNVAHHQADAGRYGAASRIMQFALLPLLALVNATHVSFLRGRGGQGQMRRALQSSVMAMAYGLPAALCLFLAAPLAPLVLTKDFSETTRMLQWLAPLVILRGQSTFPMNGLMGLGRNDLRAKLYVGNAILSVVLFVVLIPRYSWHGGLAASFITEVTISVAGWYALWRCDRERVPGSGGQPLAGADAA